MRHEVLIDAESVLSCLFRMVESLIRTAHQTGDRFMGIYGCKSYAHRYGTGKAEMAILNAMPKPLEGSDRIRLFLRPNNDDKLLAPEPQLYILGPEGLFYDTSYEDEDIIAVYMAERIVDMLEIIDVEYAEPKPP